MKRAVVGIITALALTLALAAPVSAQGSCPELAALLVEEAQAGTLGQDASALAKTEPGAIAATVQQLMEQFC
jgi:hypothetical protein